MKEEFFEIQAIPAVLYGDPAEKVYLFIHGKHGNKEEAGKFAEIACGAGWQVLSVDLPEHGARSYETGMFDPWHVVTELKAVMDFAREHWEHVAVRATSIGAWFSMLAFEQQPLEQSLFVSPILNMEHLIQDMVQWAGVTEEELQIRGQIETPFGETLSWPYFQYAKGHPIERWTCPTAILYADGDNMTRRQDLDNFAAQFHCDVTVVKDGGHWFHTPEQLDSLEQWTRSRIAPDLPAEECLFFSGRPEALALYKVLRGCVLSEIGMVHIKVQKTQITFYGRHGFAFVSHPRRKKDRGILVSFGLFHQQQSPRIQYFSQPYPNRWTHHMLIQSTQEIDGELMGWLQEAYWFSEQKR